MGPLCIVSDIGGPQESSSAMERPDDFSRSQTRARSPSRSPACSTPPTIDEESESRRSRATHGAASIDATARRFISLYELLRSSGPQMPLVSLDELQAFARKAAPDRHDAYSERALTAAYKEYLPRRPPPLARAQLKVDGTHYDSLFRVLEDLDVRFENGSIACASIPLTSDRPGIFSCPSSGSIWKPTAPRNRIRSTRALLPNARSRDSFSENITFLGPSPRMNRSAPESNGGRFHAELASAAAGLNSSSGPASCRSRWGSYSTFPESGSATCST